MDAVSDAGAEKFGLQFRLEIAGGDHNIDIGILLSQLRDYIHSSHLRQPEIQQHDVDF